MSEKLDLLQQMRDVSASIYPLAQEVIQGVFSETFTEQRFYNPTLTAFSIAPKSVSLDLLCKRTPYTNPSRFEKLLADTASAGYIDPKGDGNYMISDKGSKAIQTTNDAFYDHINKVNAFPADKLNELSMLLGRLVEAASKADLPTGTIALEVTRPGHPDVPSDTLALVDQYLDDLIAFRDDAHIAAWTPSGVNGHTWEVLSYVWNGEANTVDKLIERLPFRGYSADDYTKTLNDLNERGWIEPGTNGYKITETGRKIREDAETATDNHYFAPWQVLSGDELKRLGELLNELRETNLKIAEENKKE